MAKEVVITIHGVNPDRGWQQAVHGVLKPHFDCIAHSYSDYDTVLGPIRAIISVGCLVLSVAALLLALGAMLFGPWQEALICGILFAAAFPFGLGLGWLRRVRSSKRLMRQIGDQIQYGSPHVIAHSLGTYLVGRVIRKYVAVTFKKVLLISSVLPCNFPWLRIVKARPRCVVSVRNEYGTSDWVVKTVGRFRWLARDLGASGDVGFKEIDGLTHTLSSPVAPCETCGTSPVKVHNAPLHDYGHSEVFLGRRHARELWLPFLWGFPADELNEYLENLRRAAEFLRDKRWNEAEEIIDVLYDTSFTWTHGMTLRCALADIVNARLRLGVRLPAGLSAENVISETRLILPFATHAALLESISLDPEERIAWALHPNNAMAFAVNKVICACDSDAHD